MTSPPEPPPSRRKLDTDELIAILVAFGSIGAILFWAIGRSDPKFNLSSTSGGLISPSASVPRPGVTNAPGVNPPIAAIPSPSPELITPDNVPNVVPVPVPIPTPPTQVYSSPPPQVTAFSDVPTAYWAAPYIAELTQRGVLGGFPGGTFRPDKPVTRAEFADIVSKAFDQAKTRPALQFQDIASTHWASGSIETAVQTGFMNGYPGGVFRPNQPIPLSQLQVALVTGLNLPAPANPAQIVGKYADAQEVPKWAVDKIATAIEAGLVPSYPDDNKLTPNRNATRADAAALVYEALAKQGKVKQIQK
ncbi:S-layer homology domain-containing protein [Phormidesmis priestleyi ULC007]|uniref:S-layer homology domain-containing protein n=1 Tax=Phormidesmis priestleyi ULC007 TaxID=1920490 RepID=A0A2T1DJ98_9CYAN|nr:S-layer homology domain-containing protein [Phormidesmis priestleyi]PSB20535.1 S-layer homology domain-containing protein [Phormidesmis priestleyi ULC007]PZO54205.1 MAG: S-layer homology domain-containing protein [Phormidesmis priestleyi]